MNPYAIPGCELTPEQVIKEWEDHFKIKLERVIWRDKSPEIAIPRHILCFCLFTYSSVTKEWIAGCLHRSRPDIHQSIQVAKNLMEDKQYGKMINGFITRIAECAGKPDPSFTIDVKLNREDLKTLLPDIDDWKREHWNLKALWTLYEERRFSGRPLGKKRVGITGKSTLSH